MKLILTEKEKELLIIVFSAFIAISLVIIGVLIMIEMSKNVCIETDCSKIKYAYGFYSFNWAYFLIPLAFIIMGLGLIAMAIKLMYYRTGADKKCR